MPAVHRQVDDIALADICAHARGAGIENRRLADDGYRLLDAARLELEIEVKFLSHRDGHLRILDRREALLLGAHRVSRGFEVRDSPAIETSREVP